MRRPVALRPTIDDDQFDALEDCLRPYVEDAAIREGRRKEAAAELLREYESEHGAISDAELQALDSEWQT